MSDRDRANKNEIQIFVFSVTSNDWPPIQGWDFAKFPPDLFHCQTPIVRRVLVPKCSHRGTEQSVPQTANDGTESSFADSSSQERD
jgi:hypothetical protein